MNRSTPIYLDLKKNAASMTHISEDIVKTTSMEVCASWYRGGDNLDVVIWRDSTGKHIKHQVNIFGQVSEWNPLDGLKTGLIVEMEWGENQKKEQHFVQEVLQFDNEPHSEALHQTLEVIDNMSVLSQSDNESMRAPYLELLDNYEKSKKLTGIMNLIKRILGLFKA